MIKEHVVRLGSHPHPLKNVIPSTVNLLRWVTKSGSERGDHWFLREGRGRRHNKEGQALITIRVKPSEANEFRSSGEYNVVRALITASGASIPPRTRIENICRLPQCVNPAHWRTNLPLYPWLVEVYPDGNWQVVTSYHRTAAHRRVIARATSPDGVVHVLALESWSKRPSHEPPRALCGVVFDPKRLLLGNLAVTCTKGC